LIAATNRDLEAMVVSRNSDPISFFAECFSVHVPPCGTPGDIRSWCGISRSSFPAAEQVIETIPSAAMMPGGIIGRETYENFRM